MADERLPTLSARLHAARCCAECAECAVRSAQCTTATADSRLDALDVLCMGWLPSCELARVAEIAKKTTRYMFRF
jgi:hypothetical protein